MQIRLHIKYKYKNAVNFSNQYNMSVEEDTELRNLVAETLENKGILPKIRAELRASIFLALEENISARETLLKNEELSAFIQIPVGILILNLVREFLEFFGLDFTLSVFDPETKFGKDYNGITREKMIKDLNIPECKKKGPLLYEIISQLVNKDESKNNSKNDKNVFTLNLNHCDVSLNADEAVSPSQNLNTTYVKCKDESSSTPLGSPLFKAENESNDYVEEEFIADKLSASDNSSDDNSRRTEPAESGPELFQDNINDSSLFKQIPDCSTEYDLLKFTPVKEVKTKEKQMTGGAEKELTGTNKNVNTTSVLGDLPPLNGKTEPRKNKMNEIKAIIDQGLSLENYDDDFHSSISSKSSNGKNNGDGSGKYKIHSSDESRNVENIADRSEKTDIIEENIDEDLSDLTNNHNSPESPITLDETVSKISDIADHLESL